MSERVPLTELCVGKWGSILQAIGIDRSFLSGKSGPCVFCQGRDRWRWINRNGSGDWVCNQCTPSHGSGMDLAMLWLKTDFKGAAEKIEAVIGGATQDRVRRPVDGVKALAASRRLWKQTGPLGASGRAYFASRHLPLPSEGAVRYLDRYAYDRQSSFPMLIAKITDPQGRGVNLHRTYLALDGSSKAPVQKPRQMMPGSFPAGSAIRLFPVGKVLGIAEGIETALAAHVLYGGLPVWSAISAGGMERFVIPEGVEELVIFGDADASYTGQRAAYILANRAVVRDKITARVAIPEQTGWDWADVILMQTMEGRDAA